MTSGRAEVAALGDEVNEAARIEACASGGRALASKALVERLDPPDAAALGLDRSTSRTRHSPASRRPRRGSPRRPRDCRLRDSADRKLNSGPAGARRI
jgi:class 3 adenylate cyclase